MFTKSNLNLKIKTKHSFHLVDPSPWPILVSISMFIFTIGLVTWMHKYINGWNLILNGLLAIICILTLWFRDIIREATYEEKHTIQVRRGLRLGMILFIVSEVMFFFSFFWAFFHSSLSPVFNIGGVWPPKKIIPIATSGIPLTNTFLLLSSGASITWGHHAIRIRAKKHSIIAVLITIILACFFTLLQGFEYLNAPFNISDSVFGSCFYMTTGFHGFHVFVGTIAIVVAGIRIVLNHFTDKQHFGFEAAIWYWHFVDVVWILLFGCLYWWGQ
jgi:cytochrome c oxidase subunit 3